MKLFEGLLNRKMLGRSLLSICEVLTLYACVSTPKGMTSQDKLTRGVTVAVLDFEDHSLGTRAGLSGLEQTLTDEITEALASREGIRVIDRQSLQKVLEELSFSNREMTNPEDRLRLGHLLGAQYFVMGGFLSIERELRVDGRIVSVESGITDGLSISGSVNSRNLVEKDFARKIADRLVEKAGLASGLQPERSQEFVHEGLKYERSRDYKKALEMYEKALSIDPQNRLAREHFEALLLKELQ